MQVRFGIEMKSAKTQLILGAVFLLTFASSVVAAEKPLDFNRDIRPLLSENCFACHGPDEKHRRAMLRLDTGNGSKDVIVPGDPAASELIARITSADTSEQMPPPKSGKKLSRQEIDRLKQWVVEGAKYASHWAYVPPVHHPIPQVKDRNWPINAVDRFLLARLEQEGLNPSPDANRVTLLRRLHYDLIGLPPSREDVAEFLADMSNRAYEKQIDRLLASERFGERMAVYWLDLVRFADTVGYHGDQDHHASPYRDYVIDAFNQNLRFDRFTREQLAGDLVSNSGPDELIASCYNRLLQTSHEGGVQAKEYLAIYAADRVRNVSAVWMGATVGCAQCHDHKFDPYTAKDFYSLAAFFADIDEEKHLRGGGVDGIPTRRAPELVLPTRLERERMAFLEKQTDAASKKELEDLKKSIRKVMVTQAVTPRTVRVLPRGNWLDETGPEVQPAIPAFLGTLSTKKRATRLDLACWLTDTQSGVGGLTARVFVNRLWAMFFGVGLSRSLEDFGGQGEPPVHPELLDYLTLEFASDWDVKRLIKLLVMSRAYQQSSSESPLLEERDPENRLVARQSRFRLPAEMIRDTALSVSGLLVNQLGGASVKPYQPPGYYKHLNFPKREYVAHTDSRQWRRGVYVHWQRQYLHPMMKAFDAPTREECTPQRPRSNTALAALVLLNDPTFLEASRVFAARTLEEGGKTDSERIAFAFSLATSRQPDVEEQQLLTRLLEKHRAEYRKHPQAARDVLAIGLARTDREAEASELAAWTSVCRALLNLSETITRE